ncbi:putative DsbA family dithiol-disulfide isomerase [Pseudochelatococcus lubricantis]|uniref:DsbA family dithiol-disulfide isomerase n=1 Tax=Pseudochelatococcus lubricantis TaxID=1538102 RepID=A0ABX0UUB3_9HYPH|nr:DsbA family oxidoreductase [Pseudochelatococcus lubricantis]NIJ56561.1 putative DsbA family dithiol-disulfide isomerase [Pseudochelatococcus lubricantis]
MTTAPMTTAPTNATDSTARRPITVDIVSDVVCPWCYLGSARLAHAIAARPALDVAVHWRPFQLDPTVPAGGLDRAAYMLQKFGGDQARLDAIHAHLVDLGREEGIDFRFDRITRAPNTLDAHRLIRWAQPSGAQGDVARRLFALYFTEGADIGDAAVLRQVAEDAGLDGEVVANRLAGDWDKQDVIDEIAVAARLGVTGVPFFILGGRYGIAGAQSAEVLADALDKAVNDPVVNNPAARA